MVKRILIYLFAFLLAFSIVQAKKKKTVEIKDNTITDTTYGWTMIYPKNWKAKSLNEPNIERVFLTKKNYSINPNIQTYGGDYTIPSVSVFIQDFDGDLFSFEALIKKCLSEHKSDNVLVSKLGITKDCDFITSGNVTIDSVQARQIYVKRNYKRVLDIRGEQRYINDHEVHEIYLIKIENRIFVLQAYCEREFYDTNAEEFLALVQSLDL